MDHEYIGSIIISLLFAGVFSTMPPVHVGILVNFLFLAMMNMVCKRSRSAQLGFPRAEAVCYWIFAISLIYTLVTAIISLYAAICEYDILAHLPDDGEDPIAGGSSYTALHYPPDTSVCELLGGVRPRTQRLRSQTEVSGGYSGPPDLWPPVESPSASPPPSPLEYHPYIHCFPDPSPALRVISAAPRQSVFDFGVSVVPQQPAAPQAADLQFREVLYRLLLVLPSVQSDVAEFVSLFPYNATFAPSLQRIQQQIDAAFTELYRHRPLGLSSEERDAFGWLVLIQGLLAHMAPFGGVIAHYGNQEVKNFADGVYQFALWLGSGVPVFDMTLPATFSTTTPAQPDLIAPPQVAKPAPVLLPSMAVKSTPAPPAPAPPPPPPAPKPAPKPAPAPAPGPKPAPPPPPAPAPSLLPPPSISGGSSSQWSQTSAAPQAAMPSLSAKFDSIDWKGLPMEKLKEFSGENWGWSLDDLMSQSFLPDLDWEEEDDEEAAKTDQKVVESRIDEILAGFKKTTIVFRLQLLTAGSTKSDTVVKELGDFLGKVAVLLKNLAGEKASVPVGRWGPFLAALTWLEKDVVTKWEDNINKKHGDAVAPRLRSRITKVKKLIPVG